MFIQITNNDNHHFNTFIINHNTPNFSPKTKEHKLNLQKSSTTQLIFEDTKIPIKNLLNNIKHNHKIAFNILNINQLSLTMGVTKKTKTILTTTIKYTSKRKQFKTPIIEFNTLHQKITNTSTQIYTIKTTTYQKTKLIEKLNQSINPINKETTNKQKIKPIKKYTTKCTIYKIYYSKNLNQITNKYLQIYKKYKYIEDYPTKLTFHNAHINMIFENTNKINQLLIPKIILKRTMKNQLDLIK